MASTCGTKLRARRHQPVSCSSEKPDDVELGELEVLNFAKRLPVAQR